MKESEESQMKSVLKLVAKNWDLFDLCEAETESVWIFHDRYRYRLKKFRPDRTDRSTGSTGRTVIDRSTGK